MDRKAAYEIRQIVLEMVAQNRRFNRNKPKPALRYYSDAQEEQAQIAADLKRDYRVYHADLQHDWDEYLRTRPNPDLNGVK